MAYKKVMFDEHLEFLKTFSAQSKIVEVVGEL